MTEITSRRCGRCGLEQSTDFFTVLRRDRPTTMKSRWASHCKACKVQYVREYRLRDPEQTRRARGLEYQKVRHLRRARGLEALYGLALRAYEDMLAKQNGVCAICLSPPSRGDKGVLHVDHDHSTNAIRGLLCTNCNAGLGRFRDAPELLRAAATYLERRPA